MEEGGEFRMHDYVRGAFEALSWIRMRLLELRNDPEALDKAVKEIDNAIDDIKAGVATNFRWKLRG